MPEKTIFNIESQNLDLFFAHEIEKISPQEKSELPRDIAFKLFRGGGKFNTKSTSKLGFIAKLFILWKALNKRWFIVIEDEDNGMTPGQFMDLRKAYRKRDYSTEQVSGLISSGTFVLADKELSQCLAYLNQASHSPAYNFLVKAKNRTVAKTEQWSREMRYIAAMFSFYEANKKAWVASTGVSIPEWLILLYLYHGKEVPGSPIYNEFYKRAYQSSPSKLKRCFGTLQHKGYIRKSGEKNGARMNITALGIDTVNKILTKYALNF